MASASISARRRKLRRHPDDLAGAITVLVFGTGRVEFQSQGKFPGHPDLARIARAIRKGVAS